MADSSVYDMTGEWRGVEEVEEKEEKEEEEQESWKEGGEGWGDEKEEESWREEKRSERRGGIMIGQNSMKW